MTKVAATPAGLRVAALCALLSGAAHAMAGTLEVTVLDEHNRPIEQVAVYARLSLSEAESASTADVARTAIMDQRQHRFSPHMLVVQAGTEVLFPNGDSVSHHVYSFSAAKTFELGLYKGAAHPPIVFDEPGVVVLGCNIHDGMLGYIVVVDTPHFALTNEHGVAALAGVPTGAYSVQVWTPRVRPAGLPAPTLIDVRAEKTPVHVSIAGRLAPPHEHGGTSLTWRRY